MSQPYIVPSAPCQWSQEIKRSRFIGHLAHTASEAEAKAFLLEIRHRYPDARHWCWAFKMGPPGRLFHEACSDDGEPTGTAGKPILNVLQHSPITDVCIVVVRYFGGIKLGAGGLVRAYSGTASSTIALVETVTKIPKTTILLAFPYAFEDLVRRQLSNHHGQVVDIQYAEQITAECEVQADQCGALSVLLRNESSGAIEWMDVET